MRSARRDTNTCTEAADRNNLKALDASKLQQAMPAIALLQMELPKQMPLAGF